MNDRVTYCERCGEDLTGLPVLTDLCSDCAAESHLEERMVPMEDRDMNEMTPLGKVLLVLVFLFVAALIGIRVVQSMTTLCCPY